MWDRLVEGFFSAPPLVILLFIAFVVLMPTGVVALWLKGRNQARELKHQLDKVKADREKSETDALREERATRLQFETRLVEMSGQFLLELQAARNDRTTFTNFVSGMTAQQKEITAAISGIGAKVDVGIDKLGGKIDGAETAISARFDKVDPALLKLIEDVSELATKIGALKNAQAQTAAEILTAALQSTQEATATKGLVSTVLERLQLMGDKTEEMAAALHKVAADLQQTIKPPEAKIGNAI